MILIFDGTEFYKEIMKKKILLNPYLLLIMYFLVFVAIFQNACAWTTIK